MRIRLPLLTVIACVSLTSVACGISITWASNANQVTTNLSTVGTSYTTSRLQLLANGSFTVVSTTGTNLPCEFSNVTFTAVQGQYLSVNFTSDIPLGVYIVQDTNFQNWLKQETCGNQADSVAAKVLTTSYNFTGALPNSGRWDIVLINSSNTRDASGFMIAYLGTSIPVTEEQLSTVTTTILPTDS